uniref:Uncharacterized protein n=1 Tax=Megaselia scalaris TaxID=36166 RepID=T1H3P2_MEGSC
MNILYSENVGGVSGHRSRESTIRTEIASLPLLKLLRSPLFHKDSRSDEYGLASGPFPIDQDDVTSTLAVTRIREAGETTKEDIENCNGAFKLRKVLSKGKVITGHIRKLDGSCAEDSEKVSNILMATHFPELFAIDSKTKHILETHESVGSLKVENCGRIVSDDMLKLVINNSFKPYNLVGPDGIFTAML